MKKSQKDQQPAIRRDEWFRMAMAFFPELDQASHDSSDSTQLLSICEDLAYLVDEAHRLPGGEDVLVRCYSFVRWSIRRVDDEQLLGWIADWFFDRILQLPGSKFGCLEYLDWGDASFLIQNFTVEPFFDDVENFDNPCTEWKRRWARNRKLPPPNNFAEQVVAPNRSLAPSLKSTSTVRGSENF